MHQFKRTLIGAGVGAAVAGVYNTLCIASDITAPVSYPIRGAVAGGLIATGLAMEAKAPPALRIAAAALAAGAGGALGLVCVPFAPVIFCINTMGFPLVVGAGAVTGGIVGYTDKK